MTKDTFVLDTDASEVALEVVLSQHQDGVERVIGYGSKTLSREERNYCVTRRELLAVIHFVKAYRYYLIGKPFIIRTDHAAIRWMVQQRNPQDQLARWIQQLSEYQYTIEHRPGKKHGNADGMSRYKCFRSGPCFHPETEPPEPQRNQGPSEPKETTNTMDVDRPLAPPQIVAAMLDANVGTTHDTTNGPELEVGLTTEDLSRLQREDPDLGYIME